jgi:hypothetical protein
MLVAAFNGKTDIISEAHTVYKSEGKGQEIIDTDGPGGKFFLKEIGNSCDHDGHRNQELHPFAVKTDYIIHTQCQRKGVTDGESGHQYQHLFPVLQQVNGSQGCYEQLVIQSIFADDMLPAGTKIKSEILHRIENLSRLLC